MQPAKHIAPPRKLPHQHDLEDGDATEAAPSVETADFTQEIEAPLIDPFRPDEPTLSKVDFDELEIKLDF